MFGVVPKVMWSKLIPVDEYNCIPQATNCVLVQTGRQNVLIDTGYGSKLRDKERALLSADPGDPIVDNLKAKGLSPDDIDLVILSHLHFDHAGGGIRLAEGKLVTDVLPGRIRRAAARVGDCDGRLSRAAGRLSAGEHRAPQGFRPASTRRRRRRDHPGNLRENHRRTHQRPAGPVY